MKQCARQVLHNGQTVASTSIPQVRRHTKLADSMVSRALDGSTSANGIAVQLATNGSNRTAVQLMTKEEKEARN